MLYVVTPYFNPIGFRRSITNYGIFCENLPKEAPLVTIECAFNDDQFYLKEIRGPIHRVRSNSVLWQKERLINHVVGLLPSDCTAVAWIDADVIFSNNKWYKWATEKLNSGTDILHLMERIFHLPKNCYEYEGENIGKVEGIISQRSRFKNWYNKRLNNELPFSHPGFAWAAKKEFWGFPNYGLYDKAINGSGDTILIDSLFNTFDLHGFGKKMNRATADSINKWQKKLLHKDIKVDYLPVDIYHLWHGDLKNRNYVDRHAPLWKYNYNPEIDVKIVDGVYEWCGHVSEDFKNEVASYFSKRREDDE